MPKSRPPTEITIQSLPIGEDYKGEVTSEYDHGLLRGTVETEGGLVRFVSSPNPTPFTELTLHTALVRVRLRYDRAYRRPYCIALARRLGRRSADHAAANGGLVLPSTWRGWKEGLEEGIRK